MFCPDRILILSALHGLLPLERVVAPYDLRMGQPGSITPAALRQQAHELDLVGEADVIVLAGAAYTAAACSVWPHAVTPLAGTRNMGEQRSRLAGIVRAGEDATC